MEIRKAALQDLDRVAGLFTEATCDLNRRGIHMWDELYPDRACLGEDINHQSLYLMEDGGELAAAFVLEEEIDFTVPVDWQYDGRSAWICRLCVSAARQNRGYGRRAMLEAERLLREQGYEAARLDGCGTLKLICRIAVPMNRAGLICTLLLSFLDGWNMVEQPMVYLEDFGRYPISVALASVPPENPTVQLVCCILVALPPLFLFAYFNRELVEGIALGGEK